MYYSLSRIITAPPLSAGLIMIILLEANCLSALASSGRMLLYEKYPRGAKLKSCSQKEGTPKCLEFPPFFIVPKGQGSIKYVLVM